MRNFVWLVVIGILIALNVAVFLNGISLSCDACVVKFQNDKVSGAWLKEPIIVAEIQAQTLYDDYEQGYCMITWDAREGWKR